MLWMPKVIEGPRLEVLECWRVEKKISIASPLRQYFITPMLNKI